MKIWAISDLHLGFSTGKWMTCFGEHWRDHHSKIESAWRERVAAEDIVLSPGDFSWAMKPSEVAQEFEWLSGLPGRKVLIKGNHDYWWPSSKKKLEALLPEGVWALKKRALVLDGVPIIGVRGGDFLQSHHALSQEAAVAAGSDGAEAKGEGAEAAEKLTANLQRERKELLQSIDDLAAQYDGPRRPIALFHYPPYRLGSRESAFTRILESVDCSHCLFGHLHSAAEHDTVFQGLQNGIEYRLVSCDALDFVPLLIDTV